MTDTLTPDDRRLVTDGGRPTVTRTVKATDVVTRDVGGDETEMLRVPISSTRVDRDGDRFDREALEGMAEQISSDQPMVLDNHGLAGSFMDAIPYDSRETIGAQMDAEVEAADDDEADLFAFVNPDGTHEEGERMLRQVRDENQPIKFSVGFRIKGYDEREDVEDDYEGNGRVFTAADLMETSRVSIPANPDASVSQELAAKGGVTDLPGYKKHPLVQMLQAQAGERRAADSADAVAKAAGGETRDEGGEAEADDEADEADSTDAGGDGEQSDSATPGGVRSAIDRLAAADLSESQQRAAKIALGLDPGDVSEGEEADAPDPTVTDDPETLQRLTEEQEALEQEIESMRAAINDPDSPETGETDTTADADLPGADETGEKDTDPDDQHDTDRPLTQL